jgi:hypothetical protein
MPAEQFEAKPPVSFRLRMDLRAEPFLLGNEACGQTQFNNEALMLDSRAQIGEPNFCGCSVVRTNHLLEAAMREENSMPMAIEALPLARLNAFFAISVNSPTMSMVNFSCCVCSAQKSSAFGVTRRMAPQPRYAAVRMEAGAHACL